MNWAIVFLIIAVTAAVFGFTGAAAGIAQIIFVLFSGFFALSLLTGFGKRA